MLFLDRVVKTILLEEGQVLVSLEDLGIEDNDLNQLFESIYEQSRPYIQRYVKKSISASTSPLHLPDAVSIKRVSYDTFMNQYNRVASDIPQRNWDFNPHTRMFTTFASMNYIVEYLTYPKCGRLQFTESIILDGTKAKYKLPCKPLKSSVKLIYAGQQYKIVKEDDHKVYIGTDEDNIIANIERHNLGMCINLPETVEGFDAVALDFTTKNYAIEEWDMKAEIFMTWFKAALLSMIGAIKEQAGNIDSASMPFDVNRDGLLSRARELYAKLDELKQSKSCWWEF